MSRRILLIEDDPIMGESLLMRLQLEGYSVHWTQQGEEALKYLEQRRVDLVVADISLHDLDGEQVFARVKSRSVYPPYFVFITAHASTARAVALLKQGASDYLVKPFEPSALLAQVEALLGTNGKHRDEIAPDALGVSESMVRLEVVAKRVALKASTILITGESGTGKEVLAHFIHNVAEGGGERQPFVAVNCSAIPESLIESELFGHEKGAFTGADRRRIGLIEQANGGTLFLDEIGELSQTVQVRLLRVLQDRVVQRLGARESTQVEVRLICATHRSIEQLVANAQFREDLWYRINGLHLQIPPLRQRLDDILWLARNYLEAFSLKNGGAIRILDSSARAWMLTHTWPGNVRELFNRLERACILFDTEVIRARHLIDPERIDDVEASLPTLSAFMEEAERDYLASTLKRYGGRVSQTASQLGISRKTLWEKSRRHGLTASEPSDTSQRVSD